MDHHRHLNIIEFLQDLEARGERLELVDGRLHYSARQGGPRQEDVQVIRAHRDELLAWLQETAAEPDEYPLSAGQQGLWMAWRLEPETPIYNLFFVARLQEAVEVDALQQALQLLSRQHPVLRTRYPLPEGAEAVLPRQHVDRDCCVELPVHDGEGWTEARVTAWIEQESERAFDLAQGPVMRTSVLRTVVAGGMVQHLFHWTIHHIASDFLTQEVLIEDLENFYRAVCTGSAPEVAKAELGYREFVRWEQDVMRQEGESLRAYWKSQVAHWPVPPRLPADLSAVNPDGAGHYRGATLDFGVDAALTDALRTFTRNQHVSLFTCLLTAYQVVLARYSGRDHFLVTTPTAVRHLAGWSRTAGYLINPLCLEVDLSGNPSVRELLGRTQSRLASAFEHQMLPFSEVLRLLQAADASGRSNKPTFGFILDAARRPARAVSLFAETLAIGQRGTPEELSLSMFDMAGELSGQFTYDANRFQPHSIQRLTDYLQATIRAMLEHLAQPALELPLLTAAMRQQILQDWTATEVQADTAVDTRDLPLYAQFMQQVERTPDAVALIDCAEDQTDSTLSYRALADWADRVAHQLRLEGIGRETLVGVFVDRSMTMVAGLLGILKVGAAYLPLDPSYPRARLEYMLHDSGTPLLITRASLRGELPATSARVVDIDRDALPELTEGVNTGDITVAPTDLAYVIYTSGSTGLPKGVQALHRATSNRLAWMWRTLPFTPGEVCCQKTALSFVDSVWEIFGPLLQGVPSVIIPALAVKDVPRLMDTLAHYQVTRIVLVPSLLRAMLASGGQPLQERLPKLRHWVCSGETLPIPLVQAFYAQFPDARLINLYGSSEVAADVTWYDTTALKAQAEWSLPQVPIGQPIDNAQCYILDERLQPVPPGIEGELYVGGDCLARGYLNRPEMTRERFIGNPFGAGRLFRTGDRARWLPAESADAHCRPDIEFLGRNDSQVKIRGFRVELSEIEVRLRAHPAVSEALVQLQEHSSGSRLVAYVAASQPPAPADLYWHLQQDLPDYMVPSAFVVLESLPLTPNGKVDRQVLAQMEVAAPVNAGVSEPPVTALEQALAAIWSRQLGVKPVGRHDNFFVLGGHSLLVTQVITQIQSELQVVLPLRTVFDHPTVAELAQQIEAQGTVPVEPPLLPQPRPAELPLSFAQERLWFLAQLENTAEAYNIALALRLQGALQVEALVAALATVVGRHEILRTCFPARDGSPRQQLAEPEPVPFETIELAHLPEPERTNACMRLLREHSVQPFDLARGPLIRAVLAHIGEEGHVLLLCVHHIVADGWSLGVLTWELDAAYRSALTGQAATLPPLALQYADYAIWQRALATGNEWQQQLHWWQQQLDGAPTLLGLPTDHPRPSVQDSAGATFPFTLSEPLTSQLERLGEQHGVSLFMMLLAVWSVLLGRYSNEDDLVIGTPIANRHRPGLDPLIGCFVNTLPLRVDLSGDPSFTALLGRLRQVTLDAYAHQDIPFERLVNELKIERSLSHSPLFQVMLSVEYAQSHPAARDYSLGDLHVSWVDLGRDHTELDLGIELVRTADGLLGWLDYSKALFEQASIERMAGHFQMMVEGLVANPACTLSALPLLTAAERRQLVEEWNPVVTNLGANASIQQLFEQQVERTPDAVAVVLAQEGVEPTQCAALTYAELNARANLLARRLVALQPGEDIPGALDSTGLKRLVGICLNRSADMLVAILGILKAGCAYVPVDPTWPEQRVAAILNDATPFALVTEPGLLDAGFMGSMIPCYVDTAPLEPTEPNAVNLPIQSQPEDAAYVMFTSGSTGIPKGVIIEHGNVVSYVHAFVAWTKLTSADRSLQHGSLAFDISIEEIFPPLSVGGSVVICMNPASIENIVTDSIRHRASMVCTTPLLMQYYNSRADELTDLRFLASGGDVLRPEDIDRLLARGVGVYNSYGPTETTVTATSYWACPGDESLPIGTPLANTRAFVLDARRNPLPVGVPGELYIGGAGVGRGYLNRPELNAERFIHWHNGEWLYRTGDRARWCANRTLEFVGRMDRQVKIRGFRVELGEIEAAISLHEAVDQIAVLPHTDADGQKRLLAYIVPAVGAGRPEQYEQLQTLLREHLRERLPNYMIPGAFLFLDSLPLTSTGKIDRKALPAPQETDAPQALHRPRSVTEQDLLAIWREVLQNSAVGIFDNFFELGGHSLLAVRLAAQIAAAFATEMPLQALFRYPTVAELAAYLEQANPDLSWSTLVALQAHGNKAVLFCVPGDGGNVFYFYPLVKELGSEQPVYGLESLGLDGKQAPHATVEAAAAHHIQQIRARWPQGPYCLAGHSFGGLVVYEMAQQLSRMGETVSLLAIMDTLPPSMPLPAATEPELMMTFEGLFAEEYGLPTALTLEQLDPLDAEQRLYALKQALERLEALPSGATMAHVRGIFSVFRTNTQTEYHPSGIIRLPFELLLAEESPADERDEIIAGWSQFGVPRVQVVPGSHTTMTYPPHVASLADKLRTCLTTLETLN